MFTANRRCFWLRAATGVKPGRKAALSACALLMFLTLIAGCTQGADIQVTDATGASSAAMQAQATPQPASPQASVTAQISATVALSATTETAAVPPTPAGEAPDPMRALNVFEFFSPQQLIVKRDPLQLDGAETEEMLFTAMEPTEIVTQETYSALVVVAYDKDKRLWNAIWQSEIMTGTASPLPAVNRSGGYNGGALLGASNPPILMLRAFTLDGRAHLYMWRWNANERKGERLMMTPIGDGPDMGSDFSADLDVNAADLDNDGIFEVVADNVAGVQIWKWDGSKYAPEAGGR